MKKVFVLGMSVILILSLCACSFSFSSAKLENLATASEINDKTYKPVNPTSSFTAETPKIYLTGSLSNAPDGTEIKAKWMYLDDDPAVEIDSATYEAKDSDTDFQFNLSIPDDGWPIGKYEVKLYINDKIDKAVKFEVTGEAQTTAAPTTTAPSTVATESSIAYFQELETGLGINEETYRTLTVTDTFETTSPEIYLAGALMNAKPGDRITVYWQYTQDDPAVDLYNSYLDIEDVDTDFYFYITMPDGGWDIGSYKVQLYINGAYDTTVDFYVA
jgi:hypothetical protein